MQGAAFALAMNIAFAALFAATFAVIAIANPGQRGARAFGVSYGLGMLTPVCQLAIGLFPWPSFWLAASYSCFVAAIIAMAGALARFYGGRVPWKLMGAVALYAVVTAVFIRDGVRQNLVYELAFQMPFALAAAAAGWVVVRMGRGRSLDRTLAVLYLLLSLHFPLKGVMVVVLGGGARLQDYVVSTYALFSQALSSVLLVAIGLVTLLIVAQEVITDAQAAADTDPLSRLANRRGFERQARILLDRARRRGAGAALVMLDLDHFKRINDTFGHGIGDQVIVAVAERLRAVLGAADLVGRLGGEEFIVLMERASEEDARLLAELVRRDVARMAVADLPAVTLSAGVTAVSPDEDMSVAIRRADEALYEAKRGGRDQVRVAPVGAGTGLRAGV